MEFLDYVKSHSISKVHMWILGYQNLPYAKEDTNAMIESYHNYVKSILKAERSQMMGQRVDWCNQILTDDVLMHYLYLAVKKKHGFVVNRNEHNFTMSALILAQDIPDSDVTLSTNDGGHIFFTSITHRHVSYIVFNPSDFQATCTYIHSQ